jgi:hypothetical protein
MERRVFPIKTDSACLLKWAWSTVYFNSGTSASCHRTQKYAIDPNNFNEFHNLPEKLAARKLMLDGQWPQAGCEYCYRVEQAGQVSDRMFQLDQQDNKNLTPPELITNSTATSITPTILEVYFKNTCNMACVYCGPHHSTLWASENRKFNKSFNSKYNIYSLQQEQYNPNYDRMVADLWRYLAEDQRYLTLQRYHILGGEPFLLSELDDSIEFWNQHPNPDLVFSVITNLNIPHKRFVEYIKRFEKLVLGNKIWKLQLTASLDAWGAEQEYVRWGLDLAQWEQNFEYVINRPWISLSINSAISALTIKQLPVLLEKINQWNTQQTRVAGRFKSEPIIHSFNTTGHADDPYIFGPGVFDQDFEDILKLMPATNTIQQGQRTAMEGIAQTQAVAVRNDTKIAHLKQYLTELDQRRNTDWQKTFGWLTNI